LVGGELFLFKQQPFLLFPLVPSVQIDA
jgi:hypothetical protein